MVYNINDEFDKKVIYENIYPKFKDGNVVIGDEKIGEVRKLTVFSLNGMERRWSLDYTSTIVLCYDVNIFLVKFTDTLQKQSLECLSVNSGEVLWQYLIPEGKYDWENIGPYRKQNKGEISRIIGIYGDIIWIVLNKGNILGLHIKDGTTLFDLVVPNNFLEYFSDERLQFGSAVRTQLDGKSGLLFGINLYLYWEINLRDPGGQYMLYNIKESCQLHSIDYDHLRYQCWQGNEIVFAQIEFGQEPSYVGIFDRNSREIIWTSHEMGEDVVFKGIKKVEYEENRLYVLDQAETLHIFEKETPPV